MPYEMPAPHAEAYPTMLAPNWPLKNCKTLGHSPLKHLASLTPPSPATTVVYILWFKKKWTSFLPS